MAEFKEVMQQWNRMCNAVPGKSEYISICSDKQSGYTCPMHDSGLCNKSIASQTDKDRLSGEKIIMEWAAEHPEQVYPTWVEWLQQQRVLDDYHGGMACLNISALHPIPADIAQKLGLQPKEG